MDAFTIGNLIKQFRNKKNLTQVDLANLLSVSSKTISKWETGKGLPDITILTELSLVLGITVDDLLNGNVIENKNNNSNILKIGFYVCPICNNIITSIGDHFISCHGIKLNREIAIYKEAKYEYIEDDIYITFDCEMSKHDYISFVCGVSSESYELIKLYPEQQNSVRLKRRRVKYIYYYNNKEGLFYFDLKKKK